MKHFYAQPNMVGILRYFISSLFSFLTSTGGRNGALVVAGLFWAGGVWGQCTPNTLTPSGNNFCVGVSGPNSDIIGNNVPGTQTYLWEVNISNMGWGSALGAITGQNYVLDASYRNTAASYQFRRIVNDNAPLVCTDTSITVTITISADPTVFINASVNPVCLNGAVTLTPTITGATGITPIYDWEQSLTLAAGYANAPAPQDNPTYLPSTALANPDYFYRLRLDYTTTSGCNDITSTGIQVVVSDVVPPVISTCPKTRDVVGCTVDAITGPTYSTTPVASTYIVFSDGTNQGIATDNCSIFSVTYQDVLSGACPVVTRTWTVSDGINATNCIQTINIKDTEQPVIATTATSAALGCNPTVTTPVFTVTDNCSGTNSITPVVSTTGSSNTGCAYTQTWNANYTDACGNVAAQVSITYTWTIDTEIPVISTTATSQSLGCNPTTITPPAFTVTDNCAGTATISAVVTTNGPSNEGCAYSQTWNANYTDACSNVAVQVSITYTWTIDTQIPIISTTATSQSLGCNPTTITPPAFTVTDNCAGTATISAVVTTNGPSNEGCAYSQTWNANYTDACSNVAAQVSITYTWTIDTEIPVISTTATSQSLGCNPTVTAPAFTVTDNCTGTTSTNVVATTTGPSNTGCSYTQTWNANYTDACNNKADQVSITYTWTQDLVNPTFPKPSNQTLNTADGASCPSPATISLVESQTIPVAVGNAPFTFTVHGITQNGPTIYSDNCSSGDVLKLYVWNINQNFGGNATGCQRVIRVQWRVYDACGNFQQRNQDFTIIDNTKPVIATTATSGALGCNPTVTAPIFTVTDLCAATTSITPVVTSTGPSNTGCAYSQTWNANYTDACNNVAAQVSITYTWTIDTQIPVISTTATSGSLGCNPTTITPPAFTVTDNCAGTATISAVVTTNGPSNEGCAYSQTWNANYTDACSNVAAQVSITYTWTIDTEIPVISTTATSLSLGCNPTTITPPAFTVTDNCAGTATISAVVTTNGPSNEGCAYSQTWNANYTDACSNVAVQVSITYTWTIDTQIPIISTTATSQSLGCNPTTITPPAFTVTDNCAGTATISAVVTTNGPSNEGCAYSQTWNANYTDACSNVAAQVSITYTWTIDTEIPVISTTATSQSLGCNPTVTAPAFTVTDNCTGTTSTNVVATTTGPSNTGCSYTQTWNANYTDACNNKADQVSITYTWTVDTEKPLIATTAINNTALGCNPIVIAPEFTVTDNCAGTSSITAVVTTTEPSNTGCAYTQTWNANYTDPCENKADQVSITYTWTVDTEKPVIATTAINNTALGCNPIVIAPEFTVTDNCAGTSSITAVVTTTEPSNTGCAYTQTWNANYTDPCENKADQVSITYTWTVDTEKPVIATTAINNTALGCNPIVIAPEFTVTDNCASTSSITAVVTTTEPSNTGCAYTQTWNANYTDPCENKADQVSITYTWTVDTEKPVIATTAINNTALGCNPIVIAPEFTVTDNCAGTSSITAVVTTTEPSNTGCAYTQTWNANYTDPCENKADQVSITYTWTVDTEKPVIATTAINNTALGCNPIVIAPEFTVTDNCASTSSITAVVTTTEPSNTGCAYTQTWNANYTDPCENKADQVSITYTWTVDTEKPVIATTAINNTALGCNPIVIAPEFTVTDNCAGTSSITAVVTTTEPSNTGCAYTQTWNANYTDPCENKADQVSITYTWTVDTEKPVIATTAINNTALGCNPIVIAPEFTVTDNCAGTSSITAVVTTTEPSNTGCAYTQTWNANYTDACGNVAAQVSITYTWTIDTEIPVISTTATSQSLGCNPTTITPPAFTVTDNCAGTATISAVVTTNGPSNEGCAYSQTWNANYTDACSNVAVQVSITYTWTIDTQIPIISTTATSQSLGCNPTTITPPAFTVTDNCAGTATISAVVTTNGPSNEGCAYSQTWNANYTDACSNVAAQVSITYTWTIDTEIPIISTTATSQSLGCNPTVTAPAFTVTDNCTGTTSTNVVATTTGPSNTGCSYSQTWNANYTDACNNKADQVSITYTWTQDLVNPTFPKPSNQTLNTADGASCPSPATISLVESQTIPVAVGNAPFTFTVHGITQNGPTIYSDNCSSGDVLKLYVWNINQNFGGNATGCQRVIRVQWRVYDACGNFQQRNQDFTVIDNSAPTLTGTLPGGTSGNLCLSAATTAPNAPSIAALYTDNCTGAITATLLTSEVTGDDCKWTATYTYSIKDACNNTADNAVVVYTGGDTEAPTLTGTLPGGDSGNLCLSDAPTVPSVASIAALYTDNCTENIIVTLLTSEVIGNDCKWTATYTYSVKDDCNNTAENAVVIYTGGDTEAPTLVAPQINCSSLDKNEVEECLSTAVEFNAETLIPAVTALYKDNCDTELSVTLTNTTPGENTDCSWTFDYEFTISDACENTTTCSVVRSGSDQNPPEIISTFSPNEPDINGYKCGEIIEISAGPSTCFATRTITKPIWEDECGSGVLTGQSASGGVNLSNSGDFISGNFPGGSTTVTFTGTDECGNTGYCTLTIIVTDEVDPTIICPTNITVEANNEGCTASNVNLGQPFINDNCPDFMVTNNAPTTFSTASPTTVIWTVTDIGGNTASCSQTVTVIKTLVASVTITTPIACFEGTATLTASATGGTAATYLWSTEEMSSVDTVTAGTYTVTITDTNGCTASATVIVSQPSALSSTTNISNPTCFGFSNGNASVTATGGTAPYTFEWNTLPIQTGSVAFNVPAGIYTVTITDANKCTKTASVTLTAPAALTASAMSTPIACNGGTSTVTVTAMGGTGTITGTGTFENVSAGTHTYTVTDANNCTASTTIIIAQPAVLFTSITSDPILCNGDTTSATANVSGGTAGYTYLWSNAQTTATATGLVAGTYTVTAKDANNCTATATVTFTQPTLLVATLFTTTNPTCDKSNGSASITASGGTGPYTYMWPSPITTNSPTATGLTAGTYTVTVQDNNLCSATVSVVLTAPAALVITPVVVNPVCIGSNGSITLNTTGGTPNYQYSLNGGAFQPSNMFNVGVGTYTVLVKDDANCTATATGIELIQTDNVPPTITCPPNITTAIANAAPCVATSLALGSAVADDNCSNFMVSNDAPMSFPVGTTTVTYTVTQAGAGTTTSATCTQTITVTAAPVSATITSAATTICVGGNVNVLANVIATGTYTLVASATNGTSTSTSIVDGTGNGTASIPFTFTAPGTYTVSLTSLNDAVGCTATLSGTATIIVVVDAIISISPTATTICSGGTVDFSATLTGGDGCTITWESSANLGGPWAAVGTGATYSASNILANTYYRAVANCTSSGCGEAVSDITLITVVPDPVLSITGPTSVCATDPATLIATFTGGIDCTINWESGASASGPWTAVGMPGNTYNTGDLAAGTHYYRATTTCSGNGCAGDPSNVITIVAGNLAATITGGTTICRGQSANLTINITGSAVFPFTVVYQSNSVNQPPVTINSLPYTLTVSPTANRTYRLQSVTDANGCSVSGTPFYSAGGSAVVGVNPAATVNAGNDQTICAGATVTLNGIIGGAATSSTWTASGTGTFNNAAILNAIYTPSSADITIGSVKLILTTNNPAGICPAVSDTMVLTIMPPFTATLAFAEGEDGVICAGDSVALEITCSGGIAPWTFVYEVNGVPTTATSSSNSYSFMVSPTINTNYTLISVVSGNGCLATISGGVDIIVNEAPILSAENTPVKCFGQSNGAIDLTVTNNIDESLELVTYIWSNSATTQDISGLSQGTYTVTVYAGNECSTTATYTITQPDILTTTHTVVDNTCLTEQVGAIDLEVTGGTSPYSYLWSNGATTQDISSLANGTYTVVVTDKNGCTTSTSTSIINLDNAPPEITPAISQTIACDNLSGETLFAWLDNHGGATAVDVYTPEEALIWSNDFEALSNLCGATGTTTVVFTVTDRCGLSSTTSASFTIIDNTPPTIVTASNAIVECGPNAELAFSAWLTNHGGATATDACGEVTWLTEPTTPTLSDDCGATGSVTVTFIATDECSNSSTTSITFSIVDTTKPSITQTASSTTEECGPNANAAFTTWLTNRGGATATDSCSSVTWSTIPSTPELSDGCSTTGTVTVTFIATDACNNSSTTSATFSIMDTTNPSITQAASSTTVECGPNANAAFTTWLSNRAGATATDACSSVTWSTMPSTPELSDGCGATGSVTVTFIASDECNNSSTTSATFSIMDTTNPDITQAASSTTVECGPNSGAAFTTWLNNRGGATATDVCSNISWSTIPGTPELSDGCGATGTITVTFVASDDCSNSSTTSATFTIMDTTNPSMTQAASSSSVECGPTANAALSTWLNNHGGATATDACGGVIWSTMPNEPLLSDGCGATGTVTVTFIASDGCGNSSTTSATFTVTDTTNPSMTQAASNSTVECGPSANASFTTWLSNHGGATATDSCGSVTWSTLPSVPLLSDGCGATGAVTVTFIATDDCGNSSTTSATFTIEDTTAPALTDLPKDLIVECDGSGNTTAFNTWLNDLGGARASDACGSITWSSTYTALSDDCGATGSRVVTFKATDECGNTTTVTATFTINDTMDPTLVFNGAVTDIEVDFSKIPDAPVVTANDLCGTATVTLDETTEGSPCDTVFTLTRTWTATDACDNTTSITQVITIHFDLDPGSIAGDQTICADEDPTMLTSIDPGSGYQTVSYVWEVDYNGTGFSAISGANAATYDPSILSPAGTYQFRRFLKSAGSWFGDAFVCTSSASDTVTIVVQPLVNISVSMSADIDTICAGQSVTFTAVPVNTGTSPTYVWKRDGMVISGADTSVLVLTATFNAIPSATQIANGDSITVEVTPSAEVACPRPLVVNSNLDSVVVRQTYVPSVTIMTNTNPVCPDSSITFVAQPMNGGINPVYKWMLNNSVVGMNNDSLTLSSYNPNDTVMVIMTPSSEICVSPAIDTSNKIIILVVPSTPLAGCKNVTVVLDSLGLVKITTELVNNGSNIFCGTLEGSVSPASLSCKDVGANLVILTITNPITNEMDTCHSIVTVRDEQVPVITCDGPVAINLGGAGTATVTPALVLYEVEDNCGLTYVITPSMLDCKNVGMTTTVHVTATDNGGNTATCSTTVTVFETVPPVSATCGLNISLPIPPEGITLNAVLLEITDNCTAQNDIELGFAGESFFEPSNIGKTVTVIYNMTDEYGNTSSCLTYITFTSGGAKQAIVPVNPTKTNQDRTNAAASKQAVELKVYPSPMLDQGYITYWLPEDGDINIELWDVNARLIKTLQDASMKSGAHAINWQRETLSEGMYFVVLRVNGIPTVYKTLIISRL